MAILCSIYQREASNSQVHSGFQVPCDTKALVFKVNRGDKKETGEYLIIDPSHLVADQGRSEKRLVKNSRFNLTRSCPIVIPLGFEQIFTGTRGSFSACVNRMMKSFRIGERKILWAIV